MHTSKDNRGYFNKTLKDREKIENVLKKTCKISAKQCLAWSPTKEEVKLFLVRV